MFKLYRYLMDHQCDYKLCGPDIKQNSALALNAAPEIPQYNLNTLISKVT